MKNTEWKFSHLNGRKLAASGAMVLALGAMASQEAFAAKKVIPTEEHVPGEIVVKFRDSGTAFSAQSIAINALEAKLGANAVLDIDRFKTDKSLMVYKLKNDQSVKAAIETLKNEPSIAYSEPNYIYRSLDDGRPSDPDFGKSWGLNNVGQKDSENKVGKPGADINVLPLWTNGFTGSKNVLVAVIDTGIDWTHPDLVANLYTNPGEIAGNGKDDDGNGFIDDIHGWNFDKKNNQSSDDQNHGSHCAGVIGAQANNGVGTAGINWNVSLMPVKFLDASGGGTLQGAVDSINYARMMKVNIMSNSWGGGSFSQAMKDAVIAARDAGITFVAAAGNDGANNDGTSPTYPAGLGVENIIAVAATDNQDKIASFSNYGTKSVHVAAPGVNVYSTIKGGQWATYSGTSMATPHVAGIAALMLSIDPTLSYQQIKDRLIKTSDPVPNLKKKVVARGRVNAYNAVYGIVPPSSDPAENLWRDQEQAIESDHPYKDNTNVTFPVSVPGAKFLRVHFEKIDTENKYDKVTIETPAGVVVDEITGKADGYTSEYIQGDSLVIRLKSDASVNSYGFKVDKVQFIGDTLVSSQ